MLRKLDGQDASTKMERKTHEKDKKYRNTKEKN